MKKTQALTIAALVLLSLGVIGCGDKATTADAPAAATDTAAATGTGAVAYEPAYPEEVSTETLSAVDTAQQQTHTHADGKAHAHDDQKKGGHGHPH